MKKFILPIIIATSLFAGKFNIEAGLWNMSWEQSDAPSDPAVTSPLENKFKINDSLAKEFSVFGRFGDVKTYVSYTDLKKNTYYSKTEKFTKYGGYLGYDFGKVESYFRYVYSKTDGYSYAVDPDTQQEAFVKFSTDIKIYDLVFYPKIKLLNGYFGIGYRNMQYTLPQTLYVIGGKQVVAKMVDPAMQWNAHYVTVSINNSKNILDVMSKRKKYGLSPFINVMGGYAFNVSADSEVVDSAGYSSYIKSPKGNFIEASAGYMGFVKVYGKVLNMKIGYRYIKQTVETDSGDVYIYAKAQSEFKGIFATVGFAF